MDWTNIVLCSVIGFFVGFIVSTLSQIYLGPAVSFCLWVVIGLVCVVLFLKIKSDS